MTDVLVGVDLGGTHARAGALPAGRPGTRLLGFAKLSSRSGHGVDAVLERPFSDHFVLKPLWPA